MTDLEAADVRQPKEFARDRSSQIQSSSSLDELSSTTSTAAALPRAPSSRGIPRAHSTSLPRHKVPSAREQPPTPKLLLHPILLHVPLSFRFGFNGLLSNILFMISYNYIVARNPTVEASKIYAVLYLVFIPVSHLLAAVLVFGWPERYFSSLLSNLPIGITAIAIGSGLTAYLDHLDFNERIEEFIRENYNFTHMPPRPQDEKSEFYSSLLVLSVTSVWTYVLSVYINFFPLISEKKQN